MICKNCKHEKNMHIYYYGKDLILCKKCDCNNFVSEKEVKK